MFVNRRRTIVKVLSFDGGGYWVWARSRGRSRRRIRAARSARPPPRGSLPGSPACDRPSPCRFSRRDPAQCGPPRHPQPPAPFPHRRSGTLRRACRRPVFHPNRSGLHGRVGSSAIRRAPCRAPVPFGLLFSSYPCRTSEHVASQRRCPRLTHTFAFQRNRVNPKPHQAAWWFRAPPPELRWRCRPGGLEPPAVQYPLPLQPRKPAAGQASAAPIAD